MLVADIGNTDIVFGIFEGNSLKYTLRVPSKKNEDALFFEYQLINFLLENNLHKTIFEQTVLSSVVPELTPIILNLLNTLSSKPTILVNTKTYPQVFVSIDNPDELGTDLYTNAVAAFHSCGSACIIVDFGTALTFTAVSSLGEVLGVAIAPGLKTAVYSLFSKTAQLPEVPLEIPLKAIGKNTVNSIQSGVILGYEGLVRQILASFKKEMNETVKVFATGGLSSILKGVANEFDEIDMNLTLNGLRIMGAYYK